MVNGTINRSLNMITGIHQNCIFSLILQFLFHGCYRSKGEAGLAGIILLFEVIDITVRIICIKNNKIVVRFLFFFPGIRRFFYGRGCRCLHRRLC